MLHPLVKSLLLHKTLPPSLQLASYIYMFSSPFLTPLKAPHQSSTKTMIHTAQKEYPLSSQDCAPSLKPTHQNHSTLTCKTTNQAKSKKTKNKFFDTLETPRLHQVSQQLSHKVELGFSAFIHKKTFDIVFKSQY